MPPFIREHMVRQRGTLRAGRHAARRGFTLMEVILASLLATMLLAGLWTAMKLHMNFFEAGRRRVEAAQLQRGVLGLMQRDLFSTLPPGTSEGSFLPGATANSGSLSTTAPGDPFAATSAFDSPSTTSTSSAGLPSEALPAISQASGALWNNGGNVGLRGTAHQLELDLATTVSETRLHTLAQGTDQQGLPYDAAPELCTVVYFLVDANYEMPYTPSETDSAPGGLVRRQFTWAHNQQRPPLDEQDAAARPVGGEATADDVELLLIVPQSLDIERADSSLGELPTVETSSSETLDPPRGLIAPEIIALEFRYFDGTTWSSSWNSLERGSLPSAIEIAVAFRDEVAAVAAAQESGGGTGPASPGEPALTTAPANETDLATPGTGERDLVAEYFQGASLFEPPSPEEPWPVTRLMVRLPASGLQPTGQLVDQQDPEGAQPRDWQEPVDLWEQTGPDSLPTSPVLTGGSAPAGGAASTNTGRASGPATVAP